MENKNAIPFCASPPPSYQLADLLVSLSERRLNVNTQFFSKWRGYACAVYCVQVILNSTHLAPKTPPKHSPTHPTWPPPHDLKDFWSVLFTTLRVVYSGQKTDEEAINNEENIDDNDRNHEAGYGKSRFTIQMPNRVSSTTNCWLDCKWPINSRHVIKFSSPDWRRVKSVSSAVS